MKNLPFHIIQQVSRCTTQDNSGNTALLIVLTEDSHQLGRQFLNRHIIAVTTEGVELLHEHSIKELGESKQARTLIQQA